MTTIVYLLIICIVIIVAWIKIIDMQLKTMHKNGIAEIRAHWEDVKKRAKQNDTN